MKWFRDIMERYERWRVRTEQEMVLEVCAIQKTAFMKENGLLVVDEEESEGVVIFTDA